MIQKYKFDQFLSIVNFNILASNKTQPIKIKSMNKLIWG